MAAIELARVLYTAEATVHGGRAGHARTSAGRLEVDLSPPDDPDGTGTNPEQLFAAGYGACFQSALLAVARGAGIDLSGAAITVRVGLGPTGHGGFGLTVAIDVDAPSLDPEHARELIGTADRRCPYSNAIRGNVGVSFLLGGRSLAPAAAA